MVAVNYIFLSEHQIDEAVHCLAKAILFGRADNQISGHHRAGLRSVCVPMVQDSVQQVLAFAAVQKRASGRSFGFFWQNSTNTPTKMYDTDKELFTRLWETVPRLMVACTQQW